MLIKIKLISKYFNKLRLAINNKIKPKSIDFNTLKILFEKNNISINSGAKGISNIILESIFFWKKLIFMK